MKYENIIKGFRKTLKQCEARTKELETQEVKSQAEITRIENDLKGITHEKKLVTRLSDKVKDFVGDNDDQE